MFFKYSLSYSNKIAWVHFIEFSFFLFFAILSTTFSSGSSPRHGTSRLLVNLVDKLCHSQHEYIALCVIFIQLLIALYFFFLCLFIFFYSPQSTCLFISLMSTLFFLLLLLSLAQLSSPCVNNQFLGDQCQVHANFWCQSIGWIKNNALDRLVHVASTIQLIYRMPLGKNTCLFSRVLVIWETESH